MTSVLTLGLGVVLVAGAAYLQVVRGEAVARTSRKTKGRTARSAPSSFLVNTTASSGLAVLSWDPASARSILL